MKIDTKIWITQATLAKELGVTTQAVNNWVSRKQIESMYVKELGKTLVKRPEKK